LGYRRGIKFFLVHALKISGDDVDELLPKGEVKVNGVPVLENLEIKKTDSVTYNGKVLRKGGELIWLRFYKPRGYISSLSPNVAFNLSEFFKDYDSIAIAGRLDKESEGLLVLTNDGKWIQKTISPDAEKEKEYEVLLNKIPDQEFFTRFSGGMSIGNRQTKPCVCEDLGQGFIKVILKEGKKRQIRRMCRRLGYNVLQLKRTRIDSFLLEDLKPGEIRLT
jgi:23S rRNA pseudouridine2604 synthase